MAENKNEAALPVFGEIAWFKSLLLTMFYAGLLLIEEIFSDFVEASRLYPYCYWLTKYHIYEIIFTQKHIFYFGIYCLFFTAKKH